MANTIEYKYAAPPTNPVSYFFPKKQTKKIFKSKPSNPFSKQTQTAKKISARIKTLRKEIKKCLRDNQGKSVEELIKGSQLIGEEIATLKSELTALRAGILANYQKTDSLSSKIDLLKEVNVKIIKAFHLKVDEELMKRLEDRNHTEESFSKRLEELETQRDQKTFEKQGRCFIVRKKELAAIYAREISIEENQRKYGTKMAIATDILSEVLRKVPFLSAREAFTYAIQSRKRIAISLQHTDTTLIGAKRENKKGHYVITKLTNNTYRNLGPRLRGGSTKKPVNIVFNAQLPFGSKKIVKLDSYSYTDSLNRLKHTSAKLIDTIEKNAIVPYFNKIRSSNYRNQTECWHDLGLLFWWGIRQKYYIYSEPSATEIVVKALANDRGFPIQFPWKKGLIPWEEVIAQGNPSKFAEDFSKGTFFDKTD